jgi:serine/threonine-protein kinase
MGRSTTDTVYLARTEDFEAIDELVAIRRLDAYLSKDSDFVKTFLSEVRAANRVRHPATVRILEFGNIGPSHYVVTEYIHGQSLADVVRTATARNLGLPWHYTAGILATAADGLHAAHEQKDPDGRPLDLVHRKLTLRNILVSYEGEVKVADLGTASAHEMLTQTAPGIRTERAAYLSPEQVCGDSPDRRSDVFSLGISLYEAVCQKRLFCQDGDDDILTLVKRAKIPRPRKERPELPRELEQVILKALAKKPNNRHSTAAHLASDLREVVALHGRSIDEEKLGRIMDRLFRDHHKLKDQQIKNALVSTKLPVMEGVKMITGTHTGIDLSRVEFTGMHYLQQQRSKKGLLVAAATFFAAALALILVSWWAPWRESGETEKKASPAASKNRKARPNETPRGAKSPRKTATVTLKVSVHPRDAAVQIHFKGRVYRGSQLRLMLPRSDKLVDLKITAPGHGPQNIVVAPDEDKEVTVTLVRLKKSRPGPDR